MQRPAITTELGERTEYDARAVAQIQSEWLPPGTKGLPLGSEGLTLGAVGRSGRDALGGELPMPLLVLRESALAENIGAMAAFCERNGVLLAPHGKTTMAPQLFARQIDAGAWAMTAATPVHMQVYRRFGVQRILLANQLVELTAIEWLCAELKRFPEIEILCLVDSVEGVDRLETALARFNAPRALSALLEVGYRDGRGGVRDRLQAMAVADAVAASPHLELAGIECFEGLIDAGEINRTLERVDAQLDEVASVAEELIDAGRLPCEPLVSAGGSAYFDRVLARLGRLPGRLVLRSGCYVTQDGGFYARVSPLAGRGRGRPALRNALELWSAVVSRPEPELIIAGFGKRDAPYDQGLPSPTHWRHDGVDHSLPVQSELVGLNDQHARIRVPASCPVAPGDLMRCSVSHPCGAFDRWRMIPVVDDDAVIVDAVLTFF